MNLDKLNGYIPENVIEQLPDTCNKFGITNEYRLAHFLSQCYHESGGFLRTKENLNYSADALLSVFPKYFNEAESKAYARNPQKIANRVYANRMGNGSEISGDGWKHRGYGYIQLTGKNNQYAFADYIGDDEIKETPELIADKYPLMSAAFFFKDILPICDMGADTETIKKVTKRVNGGYIGLEDRIKIFNKIYNLIK